MDIDYRAVFSFPPESSILLRKKIKIKRALLEMSLPFIEKRIAVLGGSTTAEIVDQLELFLLYNGIKPSFYQSEYAQYWQDAVFGNEELDSFKPDIIYIHTNWRNIREFPCVGMKREDVNTLLEDEYKRLEHMWDKLAERYSCPIIQNNFDRPLWRLLGNSDVSDYRGKTNFIYRLNGLLYDYACTHPSFYVNDIDYLAAQYGLDAWSDPSFWHMYKYSLPIEAISALAFSVCEIIKNLYGKNKKVLVCDLDNTLWGGVIGDDGIEGIQIGPELPIGEVYSEFQQYIKELKSIGVVLAINSKNDESNALLGLSHSDCKLRQEDFAVIKANWQSKDRNMLEIAQLLNLGLDSFVFADDNPAEREIIIQSVPQCTVPELTRPEMYISAIDKGGYFHVTSISDDDLKRSEMYRANTQRAVLELQIGDYSEFLESLNMRALIRPFERLYYPRIAQLTNRSNQFNLTTLRCSESDIAKMADSPSWITLYGKLEDKFGDNGLVSVIAGERVNDSLHLRVWLMSCRVLKRGMEHAMLSVLLTHCRQAGLGKLIGYYYPTAKNGMVRSFYGNMGFTLTSSDADGSTVWELDLNDLKPQDFRILIE